MKKLLAILMTLSLLIGTMPTLAEPGAADVMALAVSEGATLACGSYHTVGVKTDGTVVAVGSSSGSQCSVYDWTDVAAVATGEYHTVGLKTDGTVLAKGNNDYGQCDVSDWTDIVAIAAGGEHTVGVRADGTVVAAGRNDHGECDVSDWTDIVAVAVGYWHTVGLRVDGTVVAVGDDSEKECRVAGWTDITAVAAGEDFTVGLKADGTVISTGWNKSGQCDTYGWKDIIAVSCGKWETVGLKKDGTVVSTGGNTKNDRCDTSDWADIMAVAAGQWHTVGLKWDGTVIATGDNGEGQCNVANWTDIAINKSAKLAAADRPEPTPVPTPTPVPESLFALRDMHKRALNDSGLSVSKAACGSDVVVAYFEGSDEEALPDQVLTADSEDEWDFPREYRAESYDAARWAAVIFPTWEQVGWYSGVAGGPANETTTWLALFDLQTDKFYEEKVATEKPPEIITVQTINGVPQSYGASGEFRGDDAMARLTELVKAARIANPPTPKSELTPTPAPEPASEPAQQSAEAADGDPFTAEVLAALNNDTCRATYDALLAGEVIQKGSKGDTAKGVQQTLITFGQNIAADGSVGPKTIAALNAVQAAFGLEETDSLDAAGYAQLLPRLLTVVDPDAADALLPSRMSADEYGYVRACTMVAQGKFASAKALFEECGWGNWEERAEACVQPWPKNGVLYKNSDVKGSSAELSVQFNTDPDTAMLVKVYTADGVLARTMFIGGTGKATCSLLAGTYIIKDGTGKHWYGEEEAFGERPEGQYEIMTFDDGSQEVSLEKNYRTTITVNVQEDNPDAEGVGSDWESWEDF